jgi:hypothetical protein
MLDPHEWQLLTDLGKINSELGELVDGLSLALHFAEAAGQAQPPGSNVKEFSDLLTLLSQIHRLMDIPGDQVNLLSATECATVVTSTPQLSNVRDKGNRLYELALVGLSLAALNIRIDESFMDLDIDVQQAIQAAAVLSSYDDLAVIEDLLSRLMTELQNVAAAMRLALNED